MTGLYGRSNVTVLSPRGRDHSSDSRRGRRPGRERRPGASTTIRSAPLLACLAAILGVTFVVYLPTLDNGFTNWDDNLYVTENPLLANADFWTILTKPAVGNWHPLTMWSLALNYRFAGLDPAPYHWLNLLLHLANTALVFVFVWRLSRKRFWTAAATSLFFGIHPMHVESVAWVAERKDVLYAFFMLLGLIAYVAHIERPHPFRLAVVLGAFVFSAASKPAAVVFPLALVAIDLFRGRARTRLVWLEKIPFFLVSLGAGLLTLQAQQGVEAIMHVWNPFQKILFGAYGVTMYVAKFFVPIGLSAIYPYPSQTNGPWQQFYVVFVVTMLLLPVAVLMARRERAVAFGLAFYLINIVLVLQFFSLGSATMADRYTYVSYIGLLFALAWWLDDRAGRRALGIPIRPVVAAIFLLLLPISLIQTWRRCDVWQNSETLWNDTIARYPRQIVVAYRNRGFYYHHQAGRLQDALADYDQALALDPQNANLWHARGDVLSDLNQDDSALVNFDRAIALQPTLAAAMNNRGRVRLRRGDLAGAVADFTHAIEVDPRQRYAYMNRALARFSLGEYEGSIVDSRRAISLEPGNATNYLQSGSIAFCEYRLGRHREAVTAFDQAIGGAPESEARLGMYYLYRSFSLRALGDRTRALADAWEARRLGTTVSDSYLRSLGGEPLGKSN